jgi:hypothetical protein
MIWIRRRIVALKMTAYAILLYSGILAPGMTLGTIQPCMCADQFESGEFGVIKVIAPLIHAMAAIAFHGKARGLMINDLCVIKVVDVTGIAVGVESLKCSNRFVLVAVLALKGCMSAKKREPVRMSISALYNLAPSANVMALFAIAAEFAAVNIRMTIGALRSDICKNQFYVTLPAIQPLMHPFQRKSGSAVVKIGKRADRFEACCIMTIPARQFDRAVRTGHRFLRHGIRQENAHHHANDTRCQEDRRQDPIVFCVSNRKVRIIMKSQRLHLRQSSQQ